MLMRDNPRGRVSSKVTTSVEARARGIVEIMNFPVAMTQRKKRGRRTDGSVPLTLDENPREMTAKTQKPEMERLIFLQKTVTDRKTQISRCPAVF